MGLTTAVARLMKSDTSPLVVDGFEFNTPLDAALHLLWLLQRLSHYEKHREGQPCDGFRFREAIIASRKLLTDLDYEPVEAKRPSQIVRPNGCDHSECQSNIVCGCRCPQNTLECTLPPGHDGDHIACGEHPQHNLRRWPNAKGQP